VRFVTINNLIKYDEFSSSRAQKNRIYGRTDLQKPSYKLLPVGIQQNSNDNLKSHKNFADGFM
jgi:hypothetical protein